VVFSEIFPIYREGNHYMVTATSALRPIVVCGIHSYKITSSFFVFFFI
jgi:hypothetical protein